MATPTTTSCTVEGEKFISADADPDAVCRRFEHRLQTALAAAETAPETSEIIVHVAIGERGSLHADMQGIGANGAPQEFPSVTIDVMDRSLEYNDLDRLADAVARMVTGQ